VLQHFGEHFSKVLGGGRNISPSTWDLLDTLVCEVESSLGVESDIYDEPYLQEVVECIAQRNNAMTLGANGITTPLLKVGLEPVAWLHMVILVV
jgi:hypothetical protein